MPAVRVAWGCVPLKSRLRRDRQPSRAPERHDDASRRSRKLMPTNSVRVSTGYIATLRDSASDHVLNPNGSGGQLCRLVHR